MAARPARSLSAGLTGTRASAHIDLIRGAAAVAVLIYHVRYRFFLDYADLRVSGPLVKGWYVLTSFGHDAVMIFFVLSGFLIGGTVVRSIREGRWSWKEYGTSRFVRLYVVLLPALVLTVFWDGLGRWWFGTNPVYTGALQPYRNDFFDVGQTSGLATLLGNAAFLQSILVPSFGSNGALWSLSFEWWYCAIFPCLAIAGLARTALNRRAVWAVAALGLLLFVGVAMTAYFRIWLIGAAVAVLPFSRFVAGWRAPLAFCGMVLCGAVVLLTHVDAVRALMHGSLLATDTCIGVAFALWLYVLLHDRAPVAPGAYRQVSRTLAGCSYTLYAVHLPLLVFLRAWLVPGEPWTPDARSLALSGIVAGVAFAYAWLLARLFESRTPLAREWLLRKLSPGGRVERAPVMVAVVGERADRVQ